MNLAQWMVGKGVDVWRQTKANRRSAQPRNRVSDGSSQAPAGYATPDWWATAGGDNSGGSAGRPYADPDWWGSYGANDAPPQIGGQAETPLVRAMVAQRMGGGRPLRIARTK